MKEYMVLADFFLKITEGQPDNKPVRWLVLASRIIGWTIFTGIHLLFMHSLFLNPIRDPRLAFAYLIAAGISVLVAQVIFWVEMHDKAKARHEFEENEARTRNFYTDEAVKKGFSVDLVQRFFDDYHKKYRNIRTADLRRFCTKISGQKPNRKW